MMGAGVITKEINPGTPQSFVQHHNFSRIEREQLVLDLVAHSGSIISYEAAVVTAGSESYLEGSAVVRHPLTHDLEVRWDLVPASEAGNFKRFNITGNDVGEDDTKEISRELSFQIPMDEFTSLTNGEYKVILSVMDDATPDGESIPWALPGYVFDGIDPTIETGTTFEDVMISVRTCATVELDND